MSEEPTPEQLAEAELANHHPDCVTAYGSSACPGYVWLLKQRAALIVERDRLRAENETMRPIVEAAKALRFGAYPAHGSGFVSIVIDGDVNALEDAVRAAAAIARQSA